jgi:hypothetical protein
VACGADGLDSDRVSPGLTPLSELAPIEARLERWALADRDQERLGYPRETILSRMARHGTPIQSTRRLHFDELIDYDREVEETEEAVSNLKDYLKHPIQMYYLGRIDPLKPRLRVARNQAEALGLPVRTYYEYIEKGKIWLWGWFQARTTQARSRPALKNSCTHSIQ